MLGEGTIRKSAEDWQPSANKFTKTRVKGGTALGGRKTDVFES